MEAKYALQRRSLTPVAFERITVKADKMATLRASADDGCPWRRSWPRAPTE
jgi:hypothetical protein